MPTMPDSIAFNTLASLPGSGPQSLAGSILQEGESPTGFAVSDSGLQDADWKRNEEHMKAIVSKDRVAFLMYRAPDTSQPSQKLKDLEVLSAKSTKESTSRYYHHLDNHVQTGKRHLKWEKRRDHMTEYAEAQLSQTAIGFRK